MYSPAYRGPTRRQLTKVQLISQEGASCFLCGTHDAYDMHEAITRRQVQGSAAAKEQVYQELMLCALVCRQCNLDDSNGRMTIQKKVEIYGRPAVQEALDRVNTYLKSPIDLAEYLT